jgi:hypothetical protein
MAPHSRRTSQRQMIKLLRRHKFGLSQPEGIGGHFPSLCEGMPIALVFHRLLHLVA